MRRKFSLIVLPIMVVSLAGPLALQTEARGRDRRTEDNAWGLTVGRNAPEAIASGLADQGASWLDTMANFYADPRIDNRGYFDYYRRPYYGYPPAERRR